MSGNIFNKYAIHVTEYDLKAKYDLLHHPQKVKDDTMRQKPPAKGFTRIAGLAFKGVAMGLFFLSLIAALLRTVGVIGG